MQSSKKQWNDLHFDEIAIRLMENNKKQKEKIIGRTNQTNTAPVLHHIADSIKKKGLIILISDLLDDPKNILSGLKPIPSN